MPGLKSPATHPRGSTTGLKRASKSVARRMAKILEGIEWVGILGVRLFGMPEYCQVLTIQRMLDFKNGDEGKKELVVRRWAKGKKAELQYVAVAGTLVASVVTSSFQWEASNSAHWYIRAFWYCSLLFSLWCVVIAFHLSIFLSAYDTREDFADALLDMISTKSNAPRWRSHTLLRVPITFFSWAVIFYIVGLLCLVLIPALTAPYGDISRTAISVLVGAFLTILVYVWVGVSIYGTHLPQLEQRGGSSK